MENPEQQKKKTTRGTIRERRTKDGDRYKAQAINISDLPRTSATTPTQLESSVSSVSLQNEDAKELQ